jgi:hypothetical protein
MPLLLWGLTLLGGGAIGYVLRGAKESPPVPPSPPPSPPAGVSGIPWRFF